MKPIKKDDLLPYEAYERGRDSFRKHIIELKRRRRISVGDKITLIFENRDTIQFQLQEMIRAERIVDPSKVQDELDVYNALLPGDGELSATLFIEITESDQIQRDLDAFQGMDRGQTVSIVSESSVAYGDFERGHSKEDKISAVHFVKFRPSSGWIGELKRSGSPLSMRVDHPGYKAESAVSDVMRHEWLADLEP